MSGVTALLGELLADPARRAEFRRDPTAFARQSALSAAEQEELAALAPDELEFQAGALIAKRRHEVARLVPATFARLGAAAEECFLRYAPTCWPQGHRRHLADAAAFLAYLGAHGHRPSRLERARLRFALGRSWLAVRPGRALVRGRERAVLQVLVRTRTRRREFVLGLVATQGQVRTSIPPTAVGPRQDGSSRAPRREAR
jgi:hypothetical protein